ncbi:MAG TPA: hypothetical protein VGS07_14785 [Thermoanaerobaculia bacterium]|jgi:hypothetical protein|nr:hypothetical protein [Thermoanaerobaculia bacterium]
MKTLHRFLPPAAILLVLFSSSCQYAVTVASTTPAPWSYVEDAWGGIASENPTIESDRVALPVRLDLHSAKRIDSAICIRRVNGRVDAGRVFVRVDKCLCHSGTQGEGPDMVARFGKPAPGKYAVVYDDASAGFPKIGEIEVR